MRSACRGRVGGPEHEQLPAGRHKFIAQRPDQHLSNPAPPELRGSRDLTKPTEDRLGVSGCQPSSAGQAAVGPAGEVEQIEVVGGLGAFKDSTSALATVVWEAVE